MFQSEVLFPVGGSELDDAGRRRDGQLATALLELAREIPADINWVLRVDGHTDNAPLSGTGATATTGAVFRPRDIGCQISDFQGVPANRLVSAGFANSNRLPKAIRRKHVARTVASS